MEQDDVAVAGVSDRHDVRLPLVVDRDVGDQPGVEYRVQHGAVLDGLFRQTADACPRGRAGLRC
jgi:hypothetical protein